MDGRTIEKPPRGRLGMDLYGVETDDDEKELEEMGILVSCLYF